LRVGSSEAYNGCVVSVCSFFRRSERTQPNASPCHGVSDLRHPFPPSPHSYPPILPLLLREHPTAASSMLHVNLGLSDSSNYEFYVPENVQFTKIWQREFLFNSSSSVSMSQLSSIVAVQNPGLSSYTNYELL
jgi:hypothetical protein